MPSFRVSLLLASAIYLLPFITAQTTVQFVEPPEHGTESSDPRTFKVYKVGDILDVSWATNASKGAAFDLVINQVGSPSTQIDRTPNSEFLSKRSYSWTITTDGSDGGPKFDLTFSNQFNFFLFGRDETVSLASGVYFNITNSTINRFGKLISTSSSLSTVTILPTSSESTVTSRATSSGSIISGRTAAETTTTAPTSIPQTTDTPQINKGLSPQGAIGVGVGVGLVVAALIGVFAAWFFFVRRKKEKGQKDVRMEQNSFGGNQHVEPTDAHHNLHPQAELQVAMIGKESVVEKWLRRKLAGKQIQQGNVLRSELPG